MFWFVVGLFGGAVFGAISWFTSGYFDGPGGLIGSMVFCGFLGALFGSRADDRTGK